MKKLTDKQKRFVKNRVEGKNQTEAYVQAYGAKNRKYAKEQGSLTAKKPHIQHAIDEALKKKGLTPEYAVEKLKEVIDQDKEIGAKRLAVKDALELMGFNKAERAQSVLTIENAFFNNTRKQDERTIIDAEDQ